jgi:phage shock protein PspC (stress-responsive transcriptional regulator)
MSCFSWRIKTAVKGIKETMPDRFSWAMQPTYVRLFVVYLFFVTVGSTIRALVIAWRLYAGTFRPVISVEQLCSGAQPIELARTALANGIRQRSTHELEHIVLSELNAAVFAQHLRSAESNFLTSTT